MKTDISRVTLVSGAARGIGRACADQLAGLGHEIVGLGRTAPDKEFPGTFIEVDFSQRDAVKRCCEEVARDFAVNGVLNNVGDPGPQLMEEISMDSVDRVMEINFYSAIQLVSACLPSMRSQNFGRIINVSSELALGLSGRTAYGGAKAALISVARTWAIEFASQGITSNCIAPGPVNTAFFNQNNPPGSEVRLQKENKIPIGRIGEPEDIANAAAFFMAEDSGYVTGQTLFVDGGSSLGASALL